MLQFETQEHRGLSMGLPTLVDLEAVHDERVPEVVSIDGTSCDVDVNITKRFQSVVSKMLRDALPPRHFRDCNHFVMAMCGLWMPTHALHDKRYDLFYTCRESDAPVLAGPVSMGIPNDSRCLWFGDIAYVYRHIVYGVDTSLGEMCLHKIGVKNCFALSSVEAALKAYNNEVAHTTQELGATCGPEEIFRWNRSSTGYSVSRRSELQTTLKK